MKISKASLVLTLCFLSLNVFAQEKQIVRLSVFAPGVQLEQKLAKNQTLSLITALDPRFAFGFENDGVNRSGYYVAARPTAALKYNYFHNLKRRAQKGKNTAGNSGNYFSLGFTAEANWGLELSSIDLNQDPDRPKAIYYIPLGYGIQREVNGKFFYNIMAGGIYIPPFNQAYFALNVKIGYTLWKR